MAAGTAGAMAKCGGAELTPHNCQLISFFRRNSGEEGMRWLCCGPFECNDALRWLWMVEFLVSMICCSTCRGII
jgi:hypothetical protein